MLILSLTINNYQHRTLKSKYEKDNDCYVIFCNCKLFKWSNSG